MHRDDFKTKKRDKKQHVDYKSIKPIDVHDFSPTEGSLHRVTTYRKEKKPHLSSSAWVVKHLKPTSESPTLFELEGAAGDFYRLLIGSREPKGRPIFGENKPTGLMSKLIEGYTPLSARQIDLRNKIHVKQLAQIACTALFLEEQDLHEDNIGFNKKNELIKIDHGQSLWSIAKEFHVGGRGTEVDFSISTEEIRNLPFLGDQHSAKICPLDQEEIESLSNNPVFINAKYKSLLKIVLMPDEVCHSIVDAFISSESLKYELSDYLLKRRDELLNTLLSMPEFNQFLIETPRVIDEIKLEYREFNDEFYKDKHAHRRVNLSDVQNRYDLIHQELISGHLKFSILSKVQKRIAALSIETSKLAQIKLSYFQDLKANVENVSSNEQVIDVFDNWLASIYYAEGKDDAKFNHLTCEEIMGKRRRWDPSTPNSLKFINEVKVLVEGKRLNVSDLSLDDYDDHLINEKLPKIKL